MTTRFLEAQRHAPERPRRLAVPAAAASPSLPPEGAAAGVGPLERHQHISNLVFRADSMPSFQIQTALKIMLARHRVPITAHLRPITRQRELRSVHGSAAHQQSGKWIPRTPGPREDAAAGPQSPPPPRGGEGAPFNLMVDWERPPHLPQTSIGIFSLLFLTGTRFTTTVCEAALQPGGDGTWTTCLSSEAWSPPPGSSGTAWGLGSRIGSSSSRVLGYGGREIVML